MRSFIPRSCLAFGSGLISNSACRLLLRGLDLSPPAAQRHAPTYRGAGAGGVGREAPEGITALIFPLTCRTGSIWPRGRVVRSTMGVKKENEGGRLAWRWVAAGGAILVLVAGIRMLPLGEWLGALNVWIAELGAIGFAVFIFAYILATVLFLPGIILTIGGGFLFGLLWGLVGVSAGSTIGAACAFLIGRYFAREKVAGAVSQRPRFQAIDRAVGKKGWRIVVLLRLSPLVPFNLQNYLYGLTAIRFWPYVVASWIGMLPGTLLYVYLGAAGRASVEAAAEGAMDRGGLELAFFIVGLLATVVVTVYVTRLARRALREVEPAVEHKE